ncbi:MAG: hypothetical protein ETSY1_46765 (plasmid) [Candidatus Entotheonella factor]|uniref:Uncharacterized protein n=1 Tax=Entotheonella factor TaxID=1429438 RepID=W4M1M5_ENTF1|nr:MAG: hypothetical protein ETSY1_46765 [Candidatus Entotheonella factor]
MPKPYTDEQLLIDEITGGHTLGDLQAVLEDIRDHLAALRRRADEGRLPPAALLANEFLMGSDMDSGRGLGGSVYGRDFRIDPQDPYFPPALEAIHSHPRWPKHGLPKMAWRDYLAQWQAE